MRFALVLLGRIPIFEHKGRGEGLSVSPSKN
jgi:hypothetical protein